MRQSDERDMMIKACLEEGLRVFLCVEDCLEAGAGDVAKEPVVIDSKDAYILWRYSILSSGPFVWFINSNKVEGTPAFEEQFLDEDIIDLIIGTSYE